MRALLCVLLLLTAGCSQNADRAQPGRIVYPAFDESPPPPAPPVTPEEEGGELASPPHDRPAEVPSVVVDDRLTWQLAEEQAWALREYAAAADPDDPFALTETEIRELEREDGPLLH